MAPYAPVTPTPTALNTTDKPSETRRWWTWRHTVLAAVLSADGLYIVAVISGLIWSGRERIMPPQLSQIFVATLAAATILSERLVARARERSRQDDQFAITSARLTVIEDRIGGRRWADEEPPTVPNVPSRVYASVAVAAVQQPQLDPEALARQIEDRVVERVEDRIDEARQQGHWAGYSACARDGLAGVGVADVTSLPGARNGRPSPS